MSFYETCLHTDKIEHYFDHLNNYEEMYKIGAILCEMGHRLFVRADELRHEEVQRIIRGA